MKGDKIFDRVVENPDLFGEEIKRPKKPGRDVELARQRDCKIAARLHYYRTYFPKHKNEVIMELMVQDFHLSAVRIAEVLEELDVELQRLKVEAPSLKWFKERWPRMVWGNDFPEPDKIDK